MVGSVKGYEVVWNGGPLLPDRDGGSSLEAVVAMGAGIDHRQAKTLDRIRKARARAKQRQVQSTRTRVAPYGRREPYRRRAA